MRSHLILILLVSLSFGTTLEEITPVYPNRGTQKTLVDGIGNLWCIDSYLESMWMYDGTSWTSFDSSTGVNFKNMLSTFTDEKGNFCYQRKTDNYQYDEFYRFNGSTWDYFEQTAWLATDSEGRIWANKGKVYNSTADQKLYSYENGEWVVHNVVDEIIKYILFSDNAVWAIASGYERVFKYENGEWTTINTGYIRPENDKYTFFKQLSNEHFILYHNDQSASEVATIGISIFDGVSITYYSTSNGLSNNMVLRSEMDSHGNIIAQHNQTYPVITSVFNGTTWSSHELVGNTIFDLDVTSSGDIFATTATGFYTWDNDNWTNLYSDNRSQFRNTVSTLDSAYLARASIYNSDDNSYTSNIGLWKNNSWDFYPIDETFPTENIDSIIPNDDGTFWLTHKNDNAVTLYDGSWNHYSFTEHGDFPLKEIITAGDGNIYIILDDASIYKAKTDGVPIQSGTNKVAGRQQIQISQNKLHFLNNTPYRIELFSANGRLVRDISGTERNISLNTLGLANGIYQIRAVQGAEVFTGQFILR